MISDELSNALFCFSLRYLRAELAGGGVKHPSPPPGMPWKIQTASRARVKVVWRSDVNRLLLYGAIDCRIFFTAIKHFYRFANSTYINFKYLGIL